jgi:hypothetical protein
MLMKVLRPSVMAAREWFKERDPEQWRLIRQQILVRDKYTCVYCAHTSRKFMQVNHIGAEDDHRAENLETVCPACHSVMHLGINVLQGVITLFECKKSLTNMATVVRETRKLVKQDWPLEDIEVSIIGTFRRSGGSIYDKERSLTFANALVTSIQPPDFRAYLPEGLGVVFHLEGPWKGFPERAWKWQCLSRSSHE